jgi:hypothetical protein
MEERLKEGCKTCHRAMARFCPGNSSVLTISSHKKIQQDATVYQDFISYLYEAQHVSGDTPPIIRSLKLH